MLEGTFDVAVDTPKLHRRGTLALKSSGEAIAALLTVGDAPGIVFEGTCADKDFRFQGRADLPSLGEVDYEAEGTAWGNSVDITCKTSAGKVTVFGTRLSTSAGEFKSSHEYVMAASRAEFADNESTMYSGLYADGG